MSLEEDLKHLSMHVQVQVPTELHLCEDLTKQEHCKAPPAACQARADVSLEEDLKHLSMHVQVQVPTELHLCEDLTKQEHCKAPPAAAGAPVKPGLMCLLRRT